MKKTIKCDAAVFATLRKAPKQEVDYLVDVITDNGAGRLLLSSSVKELLANEREEPAYTDESLRQLIYEFQEFGGHSLVNMVRDQPLSYAQILTDVHKKLNGLNSVTKQVTAMEEEIVIGLFGNDWRKLTDEERFDRSTSKTILSGFFKLSEQLQVNEKSVASTAATAGVIATALLTRANPWVAAASSVLFVGQKSLGEAYRVTIPFVAQVAWMRMRAPHPIQA